MNNLGRRDQQILYISDDAVFEEQKKCRNILQKLNFRKHPTIDLYSTFLQPTDDMHNHPYLTYDNVLVWKSLHAISRWLNRTELAEQAEKVVAAIRTNCIFEHKGESIFAWSVDLNGHWDVYDEPPGSLQLPGQSLFPGRKLSDRLKARQLKSLKRWCLLTAAQLRHLRRRSFPAAV